MTRTTQPPIAVVDDSHFDAHEERSGQHPECPERLPAARSGLFGVVPKQQRLAVAARRASTSELGQVHSPDYLRTLAAQLQSGGWGNLDPDTYYCPKTQEATWLAAGGAIDLARSLMDDRAKLGVALLRPPGHHAEPDHSMGFCLLNNVALAATAALDAGAQRVAIVDWDVHHGNGTQHAFEQDPRVLFVSLHQYPFYPGTGAPSEVGRGAGKGYTANVALPAGAGAGAYGEAFRRLVIPLLGAFAPDFILVSAGFDAHQRDPLASMELDSATYQAMTTALLRQAALSAKGRLGILLEGGYDLGALEQSVAAVGKALTGAELELSEESIGQAQHRAIEQSLIALSPHWNLGNQP